MMINREKATIVLTLAAIAIMLLIGLKLISGYLEIRTPPASTGDVPVADTMGEESWVVNANEEDRGGFLSEYRLERDRVRSRETTLLRELATDATSPARAREEAFARLVATADREEKELQAEALVKALGFVDCAVIMNPSATMVMISGSAADTGGQDRIKKSVSMATGHTEKSVSVLQIGTGN